MIRLFRQYIPWSFAWLGLFETGSFLLSILLAHEQQLVPALSEPGLDDSQIAPRALAFALVTLIAFMAVGLYQRRLREGLTGIAIRVAVAFVFSIIGLGACYLLFPELAMPRGVLFVATLLSFALTMMARTLFVTVLANSRSLKRRILVLGAGHRADHINQYRRKMDRLTYHVVGFVRTAGDAPAPEGVDERQILTTLGEDSVTLAELTKLHQIDEIIVSVDDRRGGGLPVAELLECKMNGIDVVDQLTHFEREHGIIKLNLVHPSWLIFSDGFRQGSIRATAKRTFDIASSLFLLLLVWPIMLLAAFAVWAESGFKGSIFYAQTRLGVGEMPFPVLKFRSMREDAEADGKARWAQKNDSRITRVGAFLRKTRIDELPQLFNVLKGDMSFVGPRPERPEFVADLAAQIDYYGERHRVKPGITGWAQICYPYGASTEDAFNKLQYDLYYVKNYNVFLDLWILIQTVEVILWNRGAR